MTTKQTVKITHDTSLDWMDAPIEATKWKNLHFRKNGSSMYGGLVHDTEEIAKKISDEAVSYLSATGGLGGSLSNGIHGVRATETLAIADYSHTIQIPMGKK